jgi:hypothetical protein
MANTEIRNALKIVREAENAVTDALDKPDLTQKQRDLLDELSDSLRDLDTLLVMIDLNKSIDRLEGESNKLTDLNKRTQKSLGQLTKVAKTVDTAAKGIDALVKAFSILVKAGIA